MMKLIWALVLLAFLAAGSHVCAQTQQTVSDRKSDLEFEYLFSPEG